MQVLVALLGCVAGIGLLELNRRMFAIGDRNERELTILARVGQLGCVVFAIAVVAGWRPGP